METVEKKQYPSQINSKTISARIPIQDYVNFLNESLNKGISLNDFILLKIYNTEEKINGNDENFISISFNDILQFVKEDNSSHEAISTANKLWQYFYESRSDFYSDDDEIFRLNKESIIGFISQSFFHKMVADTKRKNANITDVKVQINRLVKEKLHKSEQLQFLREITELLNELD